ncbi:4'-phosphopantetheinyl transferase family protein [Intrasporangium flavum]|uniref:4'-phosphopantetheinyl transferase family protein n=1 Tax=Intrasporangium flavum TaxID=1428657 RepID=UPI00096FC287|nr:4'-phosphopantetheinyl transferase superfamily protein [Intrasporangium flavum]
MSADAAAEVVRAAVGVWWVVLPAHEARLAEITSRATDPGRGVLDTAERRRVSDAVVASVAASRAVGYVLVRHALGEVLGVPPGEVALDRSCARCGEPHGRVRVTTDAGLHVSVTHAGRGASSAAHPPAPDVVAVALTRLAPVGVDLVRVGDTDFPGFEGVALHPGDGPAPDAVARARVWARKEAALKAVGAGLDTDPASFAAPRPGVPAPLGPDRLPVAVADLDDARGPTRLLDEVGLVGAVALARADASVPVVVLEGSAGLAARASGSGLLGELGQLGQLGQGALVEPGREQPTHR